MPRTEIAARPIPSTAWTWAALVAGLVSTTLCLQGYDSGFPFALDSIMNVDEATNFLEQGTPPDQGGIASTGGYNPPGMSWLYLPGISTGDVRFYQPTGALLCHVLTLLLIVTLTTRLADRRAAFWAVVFYGFSTTGMHFGSSLWPRAYPLFSLGMTWGLMRWARERDAWGLAAALFSYAAGCYLFLEFLPAGAAFVCVWWAARPPFRVLPLVVAALAVIALWYPYLKFQVERDFFDVQAQLLRGSGGYADEDYAPYAQDIQTWDPETRTLGPFRSIYQVDHAERTYLPKRLFFRAYYFISNLGGRIFSNAGAIGAVLIATLFCAILGWLTTRSALATHPFFRSPLVGKFRIGGAVLCLIGAVFCNPWLAARVFGRVLESNETSKVLYVEGALLVAGVLLLPWRPSRNLFAWIGRIWGDAASSDDPQVRDRDVFWLCYLVPWLAVCVAAVFLRYTWWLWGQETIILALALSYFPRRAGLSGLPAGCCEILTALCLIVPSPAIAKSRSWMNDGFAGAPNEQVRVFDALVDELRAENRPAARIGYQVFFNGYELFNHKFDARYRLGAPFDLYLKERFGVRNTVQGARGFSADDDYRIVQPSGYANKFHRFNLRDMDRYERIGDYGLYELWRRKPR